MKRPSASRQRAFTLIEVLVAMVIFAIMAVMSYRALAGVLDSREHLERDTAKWRDLSLFFARFDQDLAAVINRPVRSIDDLLQPAVVLNADSRSEPILSFTRAGYAQAEGRQAAPQRIAWQLREDKLELIVWPHPDMAPRGTPTRYVALENVQAFSVRALDNNGSWQTRWPAVAAGGNTPALPNGIEVTLTLQGGESFTRIFAVRGQ